MRQIEPGVYLFSQVSIFQYLLVEDSSVTLIDTGLALFSSLFINDLAKILPDDHIDTTLITHSDGDHYGAANRIRHAFNSKIAASSKEAEAIRTGKMSRPVNPTGAISRWMVNAFLPVFSTPPAEVDHILEPGQTLPVLGGLQVLDSSGHTPGHLSFYLPKLRTLFAGDSIVERNHVPCPAFGYNCWDEVRANESFERQMALLPVHLCCGHSYFKLDRNIV